MVSVEVPEAPPGTGQGEHTDLWRAFEARTVVVGGVSRQLTTASLGEIEIQGEGTSALHVGDEASREVLPLRVPSGQYPVEASVLEGSGDEPKVVAAIRLSLAKGVPRRFAYLGSFATQGHALLCGDVADAQLTAGAARDVMVRMQAGTQHFFTHATGESEPDLAVCQSGYGEGTYDAFVGLDDDGMPVQVVLDFQVLVEPIEASFDLGDVLALGASPLEVAGLSERGVKVARLVGGDVDISLDSASVSADPTIGGFELLWYDDEGEPMYGRQAVFGSKYSFSAPRGGKPRRAVLRWVAGIAPL